MLSENQLQTQLHTTQLMKTQSEAQPHAQSQTQTQTELLLAQHASEAQALVYQQNRLYSQVLDRSETQIDVQSESHPAQHETQVEAQPETQLNALKLGTPTETELDTQLDSQNETQPGTQVNMLTQLDTQHQTPEVQLDSQLETQTQTQPENELQLDSQLETQTENEMQLDSQFETQTENEMQLDSQFETQAENEMQLDSQFEALPKTQLDSQHGIQPENEMQLDTQLETLPELQVDSPLETQPETQLDSHLETQPENEMQLDSQCESQPEIQPETQPEAHQQSQPQQQSQRLEQSHCALEPGTIQPWLSVPPFLRPPTVEGGRPKAALTTGRPRILALPYPVEQCGAELQRAFPGQIGRYYVTNAFNYAYACNRMSIEMAAESMGFDKRNYLEAVRPVIDQRSGATKSSEARLEELGSDLEKDTRLTLMILKPREMSWSKLGNSLLFERSHPDRRYIADKWQLFLVLRRSAGLRHLQLATATGRKFDYNQFILYTANPGNFQRDLMLYLDSHPGTYILKRTNYSQGIGIRIYQAEKPNTVDKLHRCVGIRANLRQFVLQKYIERPLLVDKRKFDLRVYMMLLSCKRPVASGGFEHSYFAFCYPGYVKLSCYPYNQVSRDMHVHLTNQFVQKQRRSMYSRVKEATTWFPDELNEYLNHRGRTETDWCQKRLYGRIRTIVGYMAAAFRPHLDSAASPASVFRIYGPDFIIDEDLRVWLLEVNTFPSYAKNTTALSGSIRNMWREAVTVATEATLRYRSRLPVEGLSSMRNFCMAYSSEDPLLLAELVRQNFQ